MSAKKPAAKKATAAPKAAPEAKVPAVVTTVAKNCKMVERPILMTAIESFLRDHSNVESTVAHDTMFKDIEECTTLDEVFLVPLKHKMLNMDNALRFILFLTIASATPIKDEDSGEEDPDFLPEGRLDHTKAYGAIESCFDLGVKAAIWDYVDKAIDGDSDDEDEGDDEEESAGSALEDVYE